MHNAISMDAPTRWAPFSFVWPATFLIISETKWFLLLYHISYIRYMIPSSTWLFLPFHLLHIRRAIYFSHRLDGCLCVYEYLCVSVCVCEWGSILKSCRRVLHFRLPSERERDTKAFWGPNRDLAIFTMPNTSQFLVLINLFAEISRGTCPNFVRALRLLWFCFHFSFR